MLKPRQDTPELSVPLINGTRWELSKQNPESFTVIVFYRGLHCPKCKQQLEDIKDHLDQLSKVGANIVAISSDTEEIAKQTYEQWNIEGLPIGYGFPIEEARKWGLFISKGIKDEPEMFTEPGIFIIKNNGKLYASSIQTMPFARPHIKEIIGAIKFVTEKKYPARGEA